MHEQEPSPRREVREGEKTDAASSEWKYFVDQKLGSTKASNISIKRIILNWFYILAQRKKTMVKSFKGKGKVVLHLWLGIHQESQMTKGFLRGREADLLLHGCNLLKFSAK